MADSTSRPGDAAAVSPSSSSAAASRDPDESDVASSEPTSISTATSILARAMTAAVAAEDAPQAMDLRLVQTHVADVERENRSLHHQVHALADALATQTQEMHAMYQYLHDQLDAAVARTAMMQEDVAAAHGECEAVRHDHAMALTKAQVEMTRRLEEAAAREIGLTTELEQLQAFAQHKQQVEAATEKLQEELRTKTREWDEERSALERRAVQAADRTKTELLERLRATKERLVATTKDQVPTATKRTMAENEHLVAELAFQSREAEHVQAEYAALEREVKELRVRTQVLEETEAAMARKTRAYRKILSRLEEEAGAGTAAAAAAVNLETVTEDEMAEDVDIQLQVAAKQREIEVLTSQLVAVKTSLQHARQWLGVFQQEKQFVVAQQDEIIQFLVRAAQELSRELAVETAEQERPTLASASWTSTSTSVTMMAQLLQQVPTVTVALDELSSEDTRRAVALLLDKMRRYQQQTAAMYRCGGDGVGIGGVGSYSFSSSTSTSTSTSTHRRALLAKQLGVELPPINAGTSPVVSPLKSKRRVLASSSLSSSPVAEVVVPKPHEPMPTLGFPTLDSLQQLVLVATTPISFEAPSVKTKKPPQLQLQHPQQQQQQLHPRPALASPVKGRVPDRTRTLNPAAPNGETVCLSCVSPAKPTKSTPEAKALVSAWSTDSLPPCELELDARAVGVGVGSPSPSRRR